MEFEPNKPTPPPKKKKTRKDKPYWFKYYLCICDGSGCWLCRRYKRDKDNWIGTNRYSTRQGRDDAVKANGQQGICAFRITEIGDDND